MEQTAPPESPITIRYAETEQDAYAIHEFLLVVAAPAMRCPVDPIESLMEVLRVMKENVAIMAIKDGRLIGSLGIVNPPWWYNPEHSFMCDRWHFLLPQFQHTEADQMMLDEAEAIAEAAGLEFIDMGKIRERKRAGKRPKLMMMPRSSGGESSNVANGGS